MELGAAAKLLYQHGTAAKGRTSLCPPRRRLSTTCYIPVPIFVSAGMGLSPGRKPGPICQITSVLGDRPWQEDRPRGADPRHGPGAGWVGRLRGVGLVPEGSRRHRCAPAQGIAAPRG